MTVVPRMDTENGHGRYRPSSDGEVCSETLQINTGKERVGIDDRRSRMEIPGMQWMRWARVPVGKQRGSRSPPKHPPMGVGVKREKNGQGEERIDIYTTSGPGKSQTSRFHHGMALSWLVRGANALEEWGRRSSEGEQCGWEFKFRTPSGRPS